MNGSILSLMTNCTAAAHAGHAGDRAGGAWWGVPRVASRVPVLYPILYPVLDPSYTQVLDPSITQSNYHVF